MLRLKHFARKTGTIVLNHYTNRVATTTLCLRSELSEKNPTPRVLNTLDGKNRLVLQSTPDAQTSNSTYATTSQLLARINSMIKEYGSAYMTKYDTPIVHAYGANEISITGEFTPEECGYVSSGDFTIRQHEVGIDGARRLLLKTKVKGSRIISIDRASSNNVTILEDGTKTIRFRFIGGDLKLNVSQRLLFGNAYSIELPKGICKKHLYKKQGGFMVAKKTSAKVMMRDGTSLKVNLRAGTHIYSEHNALNKNLITFGDNFRRVVAEHRYALIDSTMSF